MSPESPIVPNRADLLRWVPPAPFFATLGDAGRLAVALRAAHEAGIPAGALREALAQSVVFIGYPRAIEALRVAVEAMPHDRELWTHTEPEDAEQLSRRAQQAFQSVYGEQADPLLKAATALHPDLARWMVRDGYGVVLGRPLLPVWLREMCAVATLAPMRVEPQLHSHIRGCRRSGVTQAEIESVLSALPLQENDEPVWRNLVTRVYSDSHPESSGTPGVE